MSGFISQYGVQTKRNILVSELIRMGIKFPNIQRDVITEHINEIVEFQRNYFEKRGHFLWLGCLEFCRFKGYLYCIDGQHRYFAMEILKNENPDYDWVVDIEIIECQSEYEMVEKFQIINKNRPVPEFLKKIEDVDMMARVKSFRDYLAKTYRDYISKSEHPQKPNINLDSFINAIDKKYKLNSFETFEQLVSWFEEENDQHRTTLLERYKGINSVEKVLEKIELGTKTRHGKRLYLSCYWLDNPQNKLSITIRRKAWNNWFSQQPAENKTDLGEILCPCCEETYISAFQFEAGHKRSFKNGGTDEISNLIPICSTCNRSMGVMDYDTYKNSLA